MPYILSNDIPLNLHSPTVPPHRWLAPIHLGKTRQALILISGETLTVSCPASSNDTLFMTFGPGLPEISHDGLTVTISIETPTGWVTLLEFPVTNAHQDILREMSLDLGVSPQPDRKVQIKIGAGPKRNSRADWFAIGDLIIGPRDQLPLLRSRAFRKLRIENEIAHFSDVYDHELYNSRKELALATQPPRPPTPGFQPGSAPEIELSTLPPQPGEDVFHYAHRLLSRAIVGKHPDFHQRMADMVAAGRNRIISLCAGTAQVEASLVRATDAPTVLTIVDINQQLIDKAAAAMPDHCRIVSLVQDANELELEANAYDIAIFVSGVHHIVELERLWQQFHHSLAPGGELWLIGEQIGPNGNMLNAETWHVANQVFQSLPEKYRINALTGEVDTALPNQDCAEATFEGIRSSEIEGTLSRHFSPVHVYRRNCFLWKLLNQTYFANYDLSSPDDVAVVHQLVKAEVLHFQSGGQPTELHGVYMGN